MFNVAFVTFLRSTRARVRTPRDTRRWNLHRRSVDPSMALCSQHSWGKGPRTKGEGVSSLEHMHTRAHTHTHTHTQNAYLALGAGTDFPLKLLVVVRLVGASLRANGLLVQLLAAL